MIDPGWIQEQDMERLPIVYQELADVIGIDATIKLALSMGGLGIYLPKIDKLAIEIRDKKIREEFDGQNYVNIARKYNLTERWVREIVEQGRAEDQASLFK